MPRHPGFFCHPLVRLLGGSALIGAGCILALHFGWLDYLLAHAAREDAGARTPLIDWAALRMPFLIAGAAGGLGCGYLGRRGGWLSGLVGGFMCFLLPYVHFTLAGADMGFLLTEPALVDGLIVGLALAMGGGVMGEALARREHGVPLSDVAADEERGFGG